MDKRIRYKVKKGDFLGKIANKFGVRINDIKRWNSLKSTRLSIGQRLYIYPRKVSLLFIKQQENKLYKLTATVLCDRNKIQKRDLNSNIS